jgi:hypothetical protein
MLLAVSMAAVSQENFLGEEANRAILNLQEAADSAFAKGDSEILRNTSGSEIVYYYYAMTNNDHDLTRFTLVCGA